MEFLSHRLWTCWTLRGNTTFFKVVAPISLLTSSVWGLVRLCILANPSCCWVSGFVVLTYIPLITLERFSGFIIFAFTLFLVTLCMCVRSAVTDSLWPYGLKPAGSSVHEFPRQEYWIGLPFPPPEDLADHVSCISCISRWILYHWNQ